MEKFDLKYFKKYYICTLNQLMKDINKFSNNTINICKSLTEKIGNYIFVLNKFDDTILHDLEEIKDHTIYKEFKEKYYLLSEINIKNDSLFKKIEEVYNNLINFQFLPVNENSININQSFFNENNQSDEPTNKSNYSYFYNYEDQNNANSKDKSIFFKCCKCGNNIAEIINDKENNLYCKNCYEDLIHKIEGKEINEKNEDQANRANFLNSMISLIKFIILECNEIVRIKNDKDKKIKIKVDYYRIENIQNEYINFLFDISQCIEEPVNIDEFNLENLEKDIRHKIRELLKGMVNISINLDQEENEDSDDSSGELVKEVYNENSEHDEEKEKEKNLEKEKNKGKKKLYEDILNNFYYFINIVPKNNSRFNENAKKQFENKFKLKINPNNFIVSNNNKYFIDNLVRNNNFLNLSLNEIKNLYPNLEELYEYKSIFDYLINECDIKNYIDCKGNFIIKINDKGKTNEVYYPPYGWIGIGLKIRNNDEYLNLNYNDNEWAIAYYGVGGRLQINEVKDKLKTKIKNGLNQGKSQTKWNLNDIRHHGKKIGTGVYLTPNINLVENYCGIITFNKEKYRVALMVKVKIDKIREPKDINFWILNSKYIRPYRILLKKMNKCRLT